MNTKLQVHGAAFYILHLHVDVYYQFGKKVHLWRRISMASRCRVEGCLRLAQCRIVC